MNLQRLIHGKTINVFTKKKFERKIKKEEKREKRKKEDKRKKRKKKANVQCEKQFQIYLNNVSDLYAYFRYNFGIIQVYVQYNFKISIISEFSLKCINSK